MSPTLRALASIVGMTIIVEGCSPAQESFQSVQMCIVDERGVVELKGLMRATAASEHLQFIDNSANAASELKEIGADKALRRDAAYTIDVHIEGAGGMGVTAGNLGLPPYQVALGFTEGADPAKAHRLADQLIKALSERWQVETIPLGKGAMPLQSCGG